MTEEAEMSRKERTAAFIRLLIAGTVDKRIIDDYTLRMIEDSQVPFNPIDSTLINRSPEDRFTWGQSFRELLDQGFDWTPVQRAATRLRNELAVGTSYSLEAQEKTKSLPTTVPIIVDAVRAGGLVRLNYLCIECDTPKTDWALDLVDSSFPFLLLGLNGVILHPFDSPIFDTPSRIDKLYERLEAKLGFQIGVGDLWLPDSIFRESLEAGSVFRVDLNLFQRAYVLRETYFQIGGSDEKSSWRIVVDQLGDFHNPEFSPVETTAFSEWSERQIADAGEPNPKNRETALGEDEEL